MAHSYGYIPSAPDARDYHLYRAITPALVLPPAVDMRALCSPVRDQGELGSCTAFAIGVGMREFLDIKAGHPLTPLSPLFLYYEERKREHTIPEDAGAQPRDGFKVLSSLGISPEADDPYNVAKFTNPPPAKAVKDAPAHKIASYHAMTNLAELKQCLAAGYGAVLGIAVYESFESEPVARTGRVPMPAGNEELLGGHAVFAVGYRDSDACVIVKNSWGAGWGDGGYFYLPYAYFNPELVSDFWTAVL